MQFIGCLTACGESGLPAEKHHVQFWHCLYQRLILIEKPLYCGITQWYHTCATGSLTKQSDPNAMFILRNTKFCQCISGTPFSDQVRWQHRGTQMILWEQHTPQRGRSEALTSVVRNASPSDFLVLWIFAHCENNVNPKALSLLSNVNTIGSGNSAICRCLYFTLN